MKTYSRKRHFLLQWANVLAVLVVGVWIFSVALSAPVVYFIAWIIFPPALANGSIILGCGATFIAGTFFLLLLAVYLAVRARHIGRQEAVEEPDTATVFAQEMSGGTATGAAPVEEAVKRLTDGDIVVESEYLQPEEPTDATATV